MSCPKCGANSTVTYLGALIRHEARRSKRPMPEPVVLCGYCRYQFSPRTIAATEEGKL